MSETPASNSPASDPVAFDTATPVFVPEVEVLEPRHTDAPSPQTAPTEPERLDESCFDRVEGMLDYTELAVSLLQERDAQREEESRKETTPTLSVVIPVFNEETTLREIVRQVQAVPIDKEILIVDDCSTDGTREQLKELETEPNIRVFYHEYNHGKGAALRTGFIEACGQYVLIQDADLEYDPQDYTQLLEPLEAGEADVVYGSRFLGDEIRDPSFLHRLGNGVLTCCSNLFTGQKLTDMETCYKVFRREALQSIEIEQDRFGFEPEITAKLARRQMRIREVPIAYNSRGYEEGKKIGWRDGVNALYCIVRYGLAD